MLTRKLPLIKGKINYFPKKPVCPWCKKAKVHEPNSMAVLRAGALLRKKIKQNGYYLCSDNNMYGFLELHWHEAHDNKMGKEKEIGLIMSVAKEVKGGAYSLAFCSVKCMRSYFNAVFDMFETKVERLKTLNEHKKRYR
jgi:hypothetical protein